MSAKSNLPTFVLVLLNVLVGIIVLFIIFLIVVAVFDINKNIREKDEAEALKACNKYLDEDNTKFVECYQQAIEYYSAKE